MKREIFRDIMSNPLKIQYDMRCKRVLKNKIILAWILKHDIISGVPDKPKEYDKISVVMVCLNDAE